MDLAEVKLLSVSIGRSYDEAYKFLAAPENFSLWAAGMADNLRPDGDRWLAQTPAGDAQIRFTRWNDFGVLDHWVAFEDGTTVYVPLRVVVNGDGCEVMLTLLRLPGMSDEKFHEDAAGVARDLAQLKRILEEEK